MVDDDPSRYATTLLFSGGFFSTILWVRASENEGVRIGVVWRTILFWYVSTYMHSTIRYNSYLCLRLGTI